VSALSDIALRQEAEKCVAELIEGYPEIDTELKKQALITLVSAEAVGLGVLESMLADPSITEIMVNRYDLIYVERSGKIQLHDAVFSSDMAVRAVIDRIVFPLGRRIDESSPMVDARLKDGSRINAVIAPISIHGACLTIRKFSQKTLSMEDLLKRESIDVMIAELFHLCITLRLNLIVSGGTGSGKTTLLNILAQCVAPEQRIVTIEDSAELQINHPHVLSLESRPANAEGSGQITIRDLVRNAMRMRPDRIIVGEVRGAEALDMLVAMNTGHEGSLTTLHANSPRDALARIETLVLMSNVGLPLQAIREQLASAINIIVQQTRLPCGRRLVTNVAEITGTESGVVQLQTLICFDVQTQSFIKNSLPPVFFKRLNTQNHAFVQRWFNHT
jgi:pilus assembly protein CpaF